MYRAQLRVRFSVDGSWDKIFDTFETLYVFIQT